MAVLVYLGAPCESMLRVIFWQSLNQMKSSIFLIQSIFLNSRVISFHFFFQQNSSSKCIWQNLDVSSEVKDFIEIFIYLVVLGTCNCYRKELLLKLDQVSNDIIVHGNSYDPVMWLFQCEKNKIKLWIQITRHRNVHRILIWQLPQ